MYSFAICVIRASVIRGASLDEKDKDLYYDGFSDREAVKKALIVPDYLFFGEEVGKNIDLSEWYGDKKKKKK